MALTRLVNVAAGVNPTDGANVGQLSGSIVTGSTSGSTNLGSFSAGVLQQTVTTGVATLSTLTVTAGSIPFGLSTGLLGQNNAALFWDNTNVRLGINTNTPANPIDVIADGGGIGVHIRIRNNSTSVSAQSAEFGATNGTHAIRLGCMGLNATAHDVNTPNLIAGMAFTMSVSTTGYYVGSQNTISFQTGAPQAERLKILSTGQLQASSLNAGGIIKSAVTTGQLSIAVPGTDYLVPPVGLTAGSVLFATTGGAIAQDNTNFFWDATNFRLGLGTNVPLATLDVHVDTAGNTNSRVANLSTSTLARAQFWATNSSRGLIAGVTGTAFTATGTAPNLGPSVAYVTTSGASGGTLYIGADNVLTFQTGTTQLERIKIDTTGNVSLSSLSAGGNVKAAATTGQLSIGTIDTVDITAAAVDNTKLALMATARIKGRVTAGTGAPEDLTGAQATTILSVFTSTLQGVVPASGGGTATFLRADGLWASAGTGGAALTDGDKGDIVVSSAGAVWTIDTNAVTATKILDQNVLMTKLEPIAAGKILGYDGLGGPTGSPFEITPIAPLVIPNSTGELRFATGFATGSIVFQGTSQIAEDNANFFWDNTGKRLGVGTTTPNAAIDVRNAPAGGGATTIAVRTSGTTTTSAAYYFAFNSTGTNGFAAGVTGTGFTAGGLMGGTPNLGADTTFVASQKTTMYIGGHGVISVQTGNPQAERLRILTTGQVQLSSLSASGIVSAAVTTGQLAVTTMTAGQVAFGAASGGGLAQSSGLFWDNTNKFLGIGASLTTPSFDLDIVHSQNAATVAEVVNSNTGTLAIAEYIAAVNGGVVALFGATGSGYVDSGLNPNLGSATAFIRNNNGNPLYVGSEGDITFQTGIPAAQRMRIFSTGQTVVTGQLGINVDPLTSSGGPYMFEAFASGSADKMIFLMNGGANITATTGNLSYALFAAQASTAVNASLVNLSQVEIDAPAFIASTGTSTVSGIAATVLIAGAPNMAGGHWNLSGHGQAYALALASGDVLVNSGSVFINGSLSSSDVQAIAVRPIGSLLVGTSPTWAINATVDVGPSNPKIGFFNATPVLQQNVTGSRAGNAALASLLNAIANLGLISNSTTA